jgi:hypothetical protein
MKTVVSSILISLAISTGAAFAQSPATQSAPIAPAAQAPAAQVPAAQVPAAPAAAVSPGATLTKEQRIEISKLCSKRANDNGLHGKDRQKFRTTCKKNGGQVVAAPAPKAS